MNKLVPILLMITPLAASQAADVYSVDPNHTFASFQFKHLGFSTFTAKVGGASGTVSLDTAAKTGSADITLDANAIYTGVQKFDDHLKSPDFFDVKKFPKITFKSQKFTFSGDKLTSIAGDLTVHGVTKPVTLTVDSMTCRDHPMAKVPACGADARATVKRSDFGMSMYVPAVADEITLLIGIEAMAKK
jgi:polyisoprenoid-binding protein YceI